jgi:DNA-directed RNA polymerase beta subunit
MSYIGFDNEELQDKHTFLAEDLLCPWADHVDENRLQMFNSHISQAVILDNPEFPKVFTGFENQTGEFSSSLKKAPCDLTYQTTIHKNNKVKFHVFLDEDTNTIYVYEVKSSFNISEHYGYKIKDNVERFNLEPGDYFEKGSTMFSSPCHDDENNFAYGVNLKAAFMSFKGLTYEDAFVISESTAKKLDATHTFTIRVTVNTNDVLVNFYGDDDAYKSFPDIGESIINNILCARRRINYQSILHDFNQQSMQDVQYGSDEIFYSSGKVIDVEVFSNAERENLEKNNYSSQILRYIDSNKEYYSKIKNLLEEYLEQGLTLSEDATYHLRKASDMIDPEKTFRESEKNDFDNLIIDFTIEKTQKFQEGSKITGRYGNKGTASKILPDELMPYDEDGNRVDIVLNILGVINRMNVAQLFELETTFLANKITHKMNSLNLKDAKNLLFEFLEMISPEQHDEFARHYKSLSGLEAKREFIESIIEEGLKIYIKPFFNNPEI